MPRLDVFDIREKPQFFAWHTEWLGCDYHFESSESSLKIYAEYNIIREAQYLYLFELVKGRNGFTLKFFTERDVDADFIDNEKEKVIERVTDKIFKETTLGEQWVIMNTRAGEENPDKKGKLEKEIKEHLGQKEELKKILRKKLEEFIG